MCLAVPMKIISINDDEATVEIEGIKRTVGIQLVNDVKPGEYVIVHAGFAIEKLDEQSAQETLELLKTEWETKK
jgi:hydrogenase expression/formation protein HypC